MDGQSKCRDRRESLSSAVSSKEEDNEHMDDVENSSESPILISHPDKQTQQQQPCGKQHLNTTTKSRPSLSFGISRILDNDSNSDSDFQSGNEDTSICDRHGVSSALDDVSNKRCLSLKTSAEDEERAFIQVPKLPLDLFSSVSNGYHGFHVPLSVPIHRPHPVFPALTSYTLPGWLDLRRDRFGGKHDIFKLKVPF